RPGFRYFAVGASVAATYEYDSRGFLATATQPDGATVKYERDGEGRQPGATDQVKVHYSGRTIDGTEFDSSYQRGEPVTFPLDAVIPGWSEALQLMREGAMSRVMGRPSIPASAEAVVVARDLVLASESGCCVHLAHISTAQSVALIRDAKARGVRVMCSTEPHYCALTSNELANFNTMAKLDPPLGNLEDRQALAEGLCDGTIDCLASGHIPVTKYDKLRSLVSAPPGASGIELALPVALTSLYHTGALSLPRLLECMSAAPAAVLGLNHGRLRVGDEADLVLFDPDAEWVCRARDMVSLSHCTPFDGKTLRGKVCCTIKAGRIVARDGAVM
ncbi:MAG: hypothetical protein EOM69_10220, partial [Clostridia bacterium]|nr:hypothetical protein [Clostridia bacterium]